MITEQQFRSVPDQTVQDAEGEKIGKAGRLYLDDATGKPEWVSVKTGWFGSGETFVPIRDARVVDGHIRVPYSKEKVKDAPNVDVDRGGHLSEQEEHRLYDHYGIAWDDAWKAANRPGEGGWAHGQQQGGTAAGAAGTVGAAGAAAGRPTAEGRVGTSPSDTRLTGTPAAPVAPTTAAAAGKSSGPAGASGPGAKGAPGAAGTRGAAARGDDAMTRSEERMRVGVERYETGHARLRKYVVTEEERQTVPVRHEEVRVEREPITEANRGEALSGEPISEAEYDVTLHGERPVVRTEAVPVERVRLVTEEHVEQRTVTGEVRKERIEAELPDGGPDGARKPPPATGKDAPGQGRHR
ncbi:MULTISPECIES: PRC and DUF2382 domain-containing protein [Kitasatospora]|uniref:DUF2382 domain-containing protein n=1 Tax=Kitasatospora setae (strain ATCC 33774 / DSM 43861 / JCM 3304 / KCC A-0304 / NBRC 14216 / KM-6054) TaxID=452652 RepID=E4N149_KITSK|nr:MULTISPECIES: PRC and DUF2382 domain-containing protein [Kitasatospora]BAJ31883.1 hypothetical protein KSE_61170 [Kitasatospora setae KM-6054]